MMRIACIIPTYNGKNDLNRLLDSLQSQNVRIDVLIVDSSSTDGTLELASARVGNVHVIPSVQFNHGGTRQLMVDSYPEYDIYVFMTQDAYLADPNAVANLIEPFKDQQVGAVCGRQLPHLNAVPLAQHARAFNYPPESMVKAMVDVSHLGIKTAFISNSFSAYRRAALDAVGGFPVHVVFAEDMYASARMLMANWKIVYAGNAQCRHSHNYTLQEEFSRYFDMGVFHARECWIQEAFGGAGGEGFRYVKSELSFLGLRHCYLWPSALLRNAIKLMGYKLGQREAKLSINLKRKLGMHKRYWDGPFASTTDASARN